MKTIVYTAIYGGYDHQHTQAVPVTALIDHAGAPAGRNVLRAAYVKMFPEKFLPEHDISIWISGAMQIVNQEFIEIVTGRLGDNDFLIQVHPWRNCIYTEAVASLGGVKYDHELVLDQAAEYRRKGHPLSWGLWESGCLIRRNNEACRAFNQAWWDEIEKWSVQDQLSFPYLLRRNREFGQGPRLKLKTEPLIARNPGLITIHPHAAPDIWR